MEWVGYQQAPKLLVFLQVFRKQISTISQLSGRNNQSIPPGNLKTILNKPCIFQNTVVYHDRLPDQQRANILPSIFRIKTRLQLGCNGYVELLQNLITQITRLGAPNDEPSKPWLAAAFAVRKRPCYKQERWCQQKFWLNLVSCLYPPSGAKPLSQQFPRYLTFPRYYTENNASQTALRYQFKLNYHS